MMPDHASQERTAAAETTALQALGFIASDPDRLADFIATTGITAQDLKRRAADRDVMAASLEQLLQDEANLLMFCANARIPPGEIAGALAALTGQPGGAAKQ